MNEAIIPVPTAIQMPFGPGVTIYMFGRTFWLDDKPVNWSLKSNPDAAQLIANFADELGVETIFAPILGTSSTACNRSDMLAGEVIEVPVRRCGTVEFYRRDADAVSDIQPGEAYYHVTADCPTLVMYDLVGKKLLCAHAGRDCLWDRKHVLEGAPERPSSSVVTSALACFNHQSLLQRAFICGGIAGRNFEHDVISGDMANSNARMINHFVSDCGKFSVVGDPDDGCLDLKFIITEHLVKAGLLRDMIGCDAIDTYGDVCDNEHVWWSNRGGDKTERNGILVVHHKPS